MGAAPGKESGQRSISAKKMQTCWEVKPLLFGEHGQREFKQMKHRVELLKDGSALVFFSDSVHEGSRNTFKSIGLIIRLYFLKYSAKD